MAVGFPVAKIDLDSTLGQISLQLRDSISRVTVLKGRVDALTDAELEGLGYTPGDIVLLKASIADLYAIQQIAFGQVTLPTVYDFRQNISKVTGVA
jgi:hypothetical protein